MNKEKMILEIAKATCTKAEARKALGIVLEVIRRELKKGDRVTLSGFGTFSVVKRSARNGRNPHTGVLMNIAAKKVPKFTASKTLKDYVQG